MQKRKRPSEGPERRSGRWDQQQQEGAVGRGKGRLGIDLVSECGEREWEKGGC